MLLKVKDKHRTLKSLCGFTHEETELDLMGRQLKPTDAMLIAPELGVIASLTKVCQIRNGRGAHYSEWHTKP